MRELWGINWIVLVIPGAIVFFYLYVRPMLKSIPLFQRFYEEADGFWSTVWALIGKSVTILWALFLQALGVMFQYLEPIASAFGDPDLRMQISDAMQTNPEVLGKILMGISFITVAARLQGLAKQSEDE